jgi:type IV secretory pathway VirJ component
VPLLKGLRALTALLAVAATAIIGGSVSRAPTSAPSPEPTWHASAPQRLSHGRFKNLMVYSPDHSPQSFVLFLSGSDGWNQRMTDLARQLVQQGAMVVGIDTPQLNADLEADPAQCMFPDGDLENLSHFVQAYYHLPTYLDPILVGQDIGATLAYATLAQAPKNTFGGALSLGFCPNFPLHKPLCTGSGIASKPRSDGSGVDFLPAKQLGNPWIVLQGENDLICKADAARNFVAQVPAARLVPLPQAGHDFATPAQWTAPFSAAFGELWSRSAGTLLAPPPASLSDLPIVAVPIQPGAPPSDALALLLSGDGGWAGLDRDVAAALAARGIAVIGLDSLRYFWSARTPDGLAADLDRIIQYYLPHLGKKRVLLIGYSQGADVLPFAVNRLPPETRAHVALAAVMGMSEHALFEFHVTSWVSDDNSGPATLPEVKRITGMAVVCIYGEDESDSLCPALDPQKVIIVKLKGGHHFDGDYGSLAQTILAAAER